MLLVSGLLLVAGCTGASVDESTPQVLCAMDDMRQADQQAQLDAQAASASRTVESTTRQDVPRTGTFQVLFDTTVGSFTIEVHRDWAPLGADRFYRLVQDRYYDDCAFFRVIPGFMVQFGIAGNPEMTARWDVEIMDDPVIESNQPGYVTYAKTAAPNSRSAQLFINYGDNARLDSDGFAPFGKVIEGMDVVRRINSEYGEAPSHEQQTLEMQGNKYLKIKYPNLDYIKTARLVEDPQAADSAAPAE
jgi:peptidyl-prolyl cis-trans isomerase A (cyclophilin A)